MNMASNDQLKAYQNVAGGSQRQGYASIPQPGSPTYTEAWALIEAARRLANVIEGGVSADPAHRRRIRDALRLNWRLWTIFQSELTIAENNTVPEEIRINMLTLCRFVDQHTVDCMADPTPEKIITLIDMNRNIASGLLESLRSPAAETPQGPAPDQNAQSVTKAAAPSPAPQTPDPAEEPAPGVSLIDHEV